MTPRCPLQATLALALALAGPVTLPAPALASGDGDFRTWTSTARAITGGTAEKQGPELFPDLYQDHFTGAPEEHWYVVRRVPGAPLYLSAAYSAQEDGKQGLDVEVRAPSGQRCAHGPNRNPVGRGPHPDTFAEGRNRMVSVIVFVEGAQPYVAVDDLPECNRADTLYLKVKRTEGSAPADVEILYLQQPAPVENQDHRPQAKNTPQGTAKAGAATSAVRGAGAMGPAPVLAPGSYTDEIRPGEQVFYRVNVDYGQAGLVTVTAPRPGEKVKQASEGTPDAVSVAAYAPTRARVDTGEAGNLDGEERHVSARLPQVELMNATSLDNPASAVPGYHYVAVQVDRGTGGERSDDPVPIRIDVEVQGDAAPTPAWATASRTPTATQFAAQVRSETVHGSPQPYVLGVLGAAAVAGLLAGGFTAVRRRR